MNVAGSLQERQRKGLLKWFSTESVRKELFKLPEPDFSLNLSLSTLFSCISGSLSAPQRSCYEFIVCVSVWNWSALFCKQFSGIHFFLVIGVDLESIEEIFHSASSTLFSLIHAFIFLLKTQNIQEKVEKNRIFQRNQLNANGSNQLLLLKQLPPDSKVGWDCKYDLYASLTA